MNANTQARFDLCLAEVAQSHRRADHYRLRIDTGTYKARIGHVFCGLMSDPEKRPLTEQEILADEVATHDAHIQHAEALLSRAKEILAHDPHNGWLGDRRGDMEYGHTGRQAAHG
jgi:hypothetical protein